MQELIISSDRVDVEPCGEDDSASLVCVTLQIVIFIWEVKKQRIRIRFREKCNEMRFIHSKCL